MSNKNRWTFLQEKHGNFVIVNFADKTGYDISTKLCTNILHDQLN